MWSYSFIGLRHFAVPCPCLTVAGDGASITLQPANQRRRAPELQCRRLQHKPVSCQPDQHLLLAAPSLSRRPSHLHVAVQLDVLEHQRYHGLAAVFRVMYSFLPDPTILAIQTMLFSPTRSLAYCADHAGHLHCWPGAGDLSARHHHLCCQRANHLYSFSNQRRGPAGLLRPAFPVCISLSFAASCGCSLTGQITTNAISASVNSFLLVGSGATYPSGSFSVTQASFGTGADAISAQLTS